jgi:hypothetical protein
MAKKDDKKKGPGLGEVNKKLKAYNAAAEEITDCCKIDPSMVCTPEGRKLPELTAALEGVTEQLLEFVRKCYHKDDNEKFNTTTINVLREVVKENPKAAKKVPAKKLEALGLEPPADGGGKKDKKDKKKNKKSDDDSGGEKGKGKAKSEAGPSRKGTIYMAWKDGEKDVKKLAEMTDPPVKESTVRNWTKRWANGNGLPAVAKK